jgi:hypothetical protein
MFKTVQLQVRLQLPLFGVVCLFEPVYQDFRKLAYQSLSHPEPAVIMHGTGWMHGPRQEARAAAGRQQGEGPAKPKRSVGQDIGCIYIVTTMDDKYDCSADGRRRAHSPAGPGPTRQRLALRPYAPLCPVPFQEHF